MTRFLRTRRNWPRLGRPTEHRVSMIKTMCTQLLEKERVRTTLAKAYNLQRYTDMVLAKAKKGTQLAWRRCRDIVRTDRELHKLFTTYALRYKDRHGSCTRLVRAGYRKRDGAPVAFVELIDRPGELREARPAIPYMDPFSVAFWVHQQTGTLRPAAGPIIPFAVRGYLQQQQREMEEQQREQAELLAQQR